jgi:virulence-associated protein VagC
MINDPAVSLFTVAGVFPSDEAGLYACDIPEVAMRRTHAKVFWIGRNQAVRLPKAFRFDGESVSIRREGNAIILEPIDTWPAGYAKSLKGVTSTFKRHPQGKVEGRETL